MKIFVPTSTDPSKNSTLNKIVKNILKNLKLIDSTHCIWFLYKSEKFKTLKNSDEMIIDIHDYENAVQVLQDVKPDCVITNNNKYATIDFAFSLAAKFLNIPLIYCKIVDFTDDVENSKKIAKIKDNFKRNIRKFILKDPDTKQLHGSFVMFKNKFLFETKKTVEKNTIGNIKSQLGNQIFYFIGNPEKRFSDLADLNLVNNKMWFDVFKKCGIDEKKMVLTGNPYWDEYFEIFNQANFSREPVEHKPIKVLILTTPLVEHGHWSEKQRDDMISNLIKTISEKNEFSLSFKIHPTSEDIRIYQNYAEKMNINVEIYQNESFWDIIRDFDVVISYGFSMIHTEIALAGSRMILFDLNQDFRIMPLVDSAINSGFIQKCDKFDELPLMIKNLARRRIEFNQNYNQEVEKYFYKFDGNSGKRAAEAIHKSIKKYH